MFYRNWKREIFTVPNLLSLMRLAVLPLYVRIYRTAQSPRQFLIAGMLMSLSCLTDLLDGYIARRFHQITTIGKILDPLADKLTQFTLILSLCPKFPMLKPLLALLITKELFQLICGVLYLRKGQILSGALPAGKISTAVLFVSLIGFVMLPGLDHNTAAILAAADGAFLSYSFGSYILAYFGTSPGLEDLKG